MEEKTDESGRVVAVKARWVGAGNQMDRSEYESGSSPTVDRGSLHPTGSGMKITIIDIGSAYLHSDMNEFVAVYIAAHLARYTCPVDKRLRNHVTSRDRARVKLKQTKEGAVRMYTVLQIVVWKPWCAIGSRICGERLRALPLP